MTLFLKYESFYNNYFDRLVQSPPKEEKSNEPAAPIFKPAMFSPQITFEFQNEREGLYKPKPVHIYNANTGDKSTKSAEVKEKNGAKIEERKIDA